MALLIDKTEIAKHRQISKSVSDSILNPFIEDAEMLDLLPLLGDEFYFKISESPNDYADLLDGTSYEHNGVTFKTVGLKKVLSLFAYSRYVLDGSTIDTPFGLVEKNSQNSTNVSTALKKEKSKTNQQAAMRYWQQIEKYLNIKSNLYPEWLNAPPTTRASFRVNKITKS